MKFGILVVSLLGSLMVGATSQALVMEMATCQTHDNMYRVTIMNNEGIGPVRTPNYGATVYNVRGEVLGGYAVRPMQGFSVSFGQFQYVDAQSQGQRFDLGFGSTNFRHISLRAVLNNGQVINEMDPACHVYNQATVSMQ